MTTPLNSYSTGTVAVSADGTTVTGTSTIWSSAGNVKPGDLFQSGHYVVPITDVTDDAHLVITPWPGSTLSGASYTVWKVSQQRIVGETYARSVDQLVSAMDTSGFFVFVNVNQTVPDPSLGDDGQYAFQPTSGKTWVKLAGVWTYLGIYKGMQFRGAYDNAATYSTGDVQTTSGTSYVYINATPSAGHTPPNTTYWQVLASIGNTGATGPTGAGYGGTSTTSLAIGTGSKAFTTQAGLAYTNGARVRASSAANTSNWMEGLATYSGTTLTIAVDKIGGSGTLADWNFNVVGQPGAGDLSSANNLSDLASPDVALGNLHGLNYNAAQSLTASQKAQSRANAGVGNPGMHNRLINQSGAIWQRANGGAAAITDVTYAFDRWYGLTQSAGVTASQVSNAENSTPNMMRMTQANASAQRFGLVQIIESGNCLDLRGQAVVLSARVRMSASTTVRYAIIEWTGTVDTVTKDFVLDWTNGTFTAGSFFTSTSTTITATGSIALSANTLASTSLSGTIGNSANNIAIFFWTDSTQAQNITLDIGKVQLEIGSTATPIAVRSYSQEMADCLRYYYQAPSGTSFPGYAATIGAAFGTLSFPVPMRTIPTIGFPSTASGYIVAFATTATASNSTPNIPGTVSSSNVSTGVQFNTPSSLTAGNGVLMSLSSAVITLNAEL